ncbi:hypothetical protein GcM3_204010 [Golovinomyces cichoracearum]|uniref:Uncharacterized protein n=1 Tax=Golovinomyces cichoracearum TaxID=62708 RepID=A0A420HCI9_9PEZI|nr:hypothetical protein GcM3_204010 [Golovinomyces cichoracearum]
MSPNSSSQRLKIERAQQQPMSENLMIQSQEDALHTSHRHNRLQGTHEEVRERMRVYLASRPVTTTPEPGSILGFYKAVTGPVWPKVCFIVGFLAVISLLFGILKTQGILEEKPSSRNDTWATTYNNGGMLVFMHPSSKATLLRHEFSLFWHDRQIDN